MIAAPAVPNDLRSSQQSRCTATGGFDAAEFEQAICQDAARWRAVARRILRDEDNAADAVQEAYLAALSSRERFRGDSLPSTWMHRIVVNVCLMRLRAERRQSTCSLGSLSVTEDVAERSGSVSLRPELACQRQETRNHVRRCIDQLPNDHRSILLLRDIQQLGTDETAHTLALSRSAVKTRLHRARQALRALLEPAADEFCLPA
jgi:RNA polymerase sigma-70 factor (ECF subfamily)